LAKKLNVPESSIQDALAKTKAESRMTEKTEPDSLKKDTKTLLSDALLGLAMAFATSVDEIISLLAEDDFYSQEAKEIFINIKKQIKEGGSIKLEKFPEELKAKGSELVFVAEENNKDNDQDAIFQEAKFCYKRLKEIGFKERKNDLKEKIENAEANKDIKNTEELAKKFQEVLEEEKKIKEF
jgi:replicative DNA helicase